MKKKFLFAAVALLVSAPMYGDYAKTGCGKNADLPLGWSDMSGTEKADWLKAIQALECGKDWGGSATVEEGPRPSPSTEPDN